MAWDTDPAVTVTVFTAALARIGVAAVSAANTEEISASMAASTMEAAAAAFIAAPGDDTTGGAAGDAELGVAGFVAAAAGWDAEGVTGAGVDREGGAAELEAASELMYEGIAALLSAAPLEA